MAQKIICPLSAIGGIYRQMQELDDISLLREFTGRNSEEAFAALVERHINKVYSVALRHTRNPHSAEEITQAVFVILARKAKQLRNGVILEGWLYETARLTATTFIRGEIRRARREQEVYMQTTSNENESEVWAQIAPELDAALSGLNSTDRNAVVLRFFYGKNMKEIGAALGGTEEGARKRVNRAIEKLRKFFTKRGVTLSAVAIAGAVSANSVQAAPAALVKTTTAVVFTGGATASISTSTLIKGALKTMAWTKIKMAIVIGAGVLLAAGTTTIALEKLTAPSVGDVFKHSSENGYLKKAPAVVALQPSRGGQSSASSLDARSWVCRAWDWLCHGQTNNADMRMVARAVPLATLMSYAYGPPEFYIHWSEVRVILPPDVSDKKFDFLLAVRDRPQEALQAEIKRQLGLVARHEMRETDVLVLKVSDSSAVRLTAAKAGGSSDGRSRGGFGFTNEGIDILADFLEGTSGKPVVDETGLAQKYSGALKWNPQSDKAAELKEIQNALSNQLGLELVPDRKSIEMLVVEKTP